MRTALINNIYKKFNHDDMICVHCENMRSLWEFITFWRLYCLDKRLYVQMPVQSMNLVLLQQLNRIALKLLCSVFWHHFWAMQLLRNGFKLWCGSLRNGLKFNSQGSKLAKCPEHLIFDRCVKIIYFGLERFIPTTSLST